MNTIPGEQWFQPLPFARFSQSAGGRPVGGRPAPDAGRYARAAPLLAVARRDYDAGTDRILPHYFIYRADILQKLILIFICYLF